MYWTQRDETKRTSFNSVIPFRSCRIQFNQLSFLFERQKLKMLDTTGLFSSTIDRKWHIKGEKKQASKQHPEHYILCVAWVALPAWIVFERRNTTEYKRNASFFHPLPRRLLIYCNCFGTKKILAPRVIVCHLSSLLFVLVSSRTN